MLVYRRVAENTYVSDDHMVWFDGGATFTSEPCLVCFHAQISNNVTLPWNIEFHQLSWISSQGVIYFTYPLIIHYPTIILYESIFSGQK